MNEFLTVAGVAALLKLNQQTIRNWIDAEKLPAVRVGARRVRIKRSDLDVFLESGPTGKCSAAEPEPTIWEGAVPPPAP